MNPEAAEYLRIAARDLGTARRELVAGDHPGAVFFHAQQCALHARDHVVLTVLAVNGARQHADS